MWIISNISYDMAKHLSLLGVIVLVGFAYCYFGPLNEMDMEVAEIQLEVDSTEERLEDSSLTNDQKVSIIKSNIRKAELTSALSVKLLVYQIICGVFAFGGLVVMKVGFWRLYYAKQE